MQELHLEAVEQGTIVQQPPMTIITKRKQISKGDLAQGVLKGIRGALVFGLSGKGAKKIATKQSTAT